ncbi:MAG: hypothetical protein FWG90_08080 [Oscillospiraceae bacterium]|nr:hypothetical protein [Oscillospiraceae bacterium]
MQFKKFKDESGFDFCFPVEYNPCKADAVSYPGLSSVDFTLEMPDEFLFIEVKNLDNPNIPQDVIERERRKFIIKTKKSSKCASNCPRDGICPKCGKIQFVCETHSKLKDTLLKRLAKGEIFTKPIVYVLLFEFRGFDYEQRRRLFELIKTNFPRFAEDEYSSIHSIKFLLYDSKNFKEKYTDFNINPTRSEAEKIPAKAGNYI